MWTHNSVILTCLNTVVSCIQISYKSESCTSYGIVLFGLESTDSHIQCSRITTCREIPVPKMIKNRNIWKWYRFECLLMDISPLVFLNIVTSKKFVQFLRQFFEGQSYTCFTSMKIRILISFKTLTYNFILRCQLSITKFL